MGVVGVQGDVGCRSQTLPQRMPGTRPGVAAGKEEARETLRPPAVLQGKGHITGVDQHSSWNRRSVRATPKGWARLMGWRKAHFGMGLLRKGRTQGRR